ncbi:MAG TPA: response regulator [Caulobacteraceae bacterium]|jgi:signal transduction histidine kinase
MLNGRRATLPGMVDTPASPDAPVQPEPGASPRLLIVDDVFDNRAVLVRRFERRGYEVTEADSGTAGLELIAHQKFDMVLLDWMMPDLDGLEVLRRIRQTHSSVELPVIMVTAKTQSEDIVQALTLGANDYITKPVDFAVALARVTAQIGRKQAEDKVREANDALARANEDLERRIAERTVELVETNAQLRVAVDEARAANRSKDEFLANMSHELRTPLNGVIGMAQILAATPMNEQQQEMVDIINCSAEGLQTILSDLLDIVDLTSGRVDLTREAVNLGELAREAAASARSAAQQKNLAFSVEIAPDAEGEVEADPMRLRQVIGNLLSNAVKFTERGEIAMTVSRSAEVPERVVIAVRDTGVGFDADTADRLFRRFEQADGSSTRRFGGVGLGLAICQALVEQMGGVIRAEGQPGEGAVFRVELPLLPAGEGRNTVEPLSRQLHVLCVEDHPVNRKVVEYMMEVAGVRLTMVENGALAVDAYKAQAFDAVLMDMQMPVMDGLAATRAIREYEASTNRGRTPVIMVTAHGLPEHIAASRTAGADRHVTRPVSPTDLLGLIVELVQQAREDQGQRLTA